MLPVLHALTHLIKNTTNTFGRFYYCGLLLIAIINITAPGRMMAQDRGLANVINVQIPDLPKLDEGSQDWADYDGDQRPDLLITGKTSSGAFLTRLYHNTGKGFEDKSPLLPNLPQVANSAVAWGDYDQDGYMDLFISGNTGGSFISKIYHNTGGVGFAEATANGDPLPGLAYGTANWLENLRVQLTGLFVTGKTINGPFSAFYGVTVGQDNNSYVLAKTDALPGLPMLQNSAAVCKDFNSDGKPDFMMSGDNGTTNVSKLYLSVPTGLPDMIYQDMSSSIASFPSVNAGSFDAADYDGDGRPDILMTGRTPTGPVSKLYHNITEKGWGNFELVNTGIAAVKRAKVGWAGFGIDHAPGVMVSGILADGSISGKLYQYSGSGFVDVSSKLIVDKPMADGVVAWGDYDNDGHPDLLYSGITDLSQPDESRSFILLNNNVGEGFFDDSKKLNGTSNPVKIPALPVSYSSASWIDIDNDNEIDLLYTGQLYDEAISDTYSQRYFFVNDGNGNLKNTYDWKVTDPYEQAFPLPLDEIFSLRNGALAWGDFDGDRFPDLLMMGEYEPAKNVEKDKPITPLTYLLKNTGDKKSYMTDVTALLPGHHNLSNGAAAWGDFNNDGWNDLIMTGSNGTNYYTQLYQNNGGGGFSDISALLPGLPQLAYSSVQWGDYDGDGRPDLILAGKDISGAGITKLYHNTSSGFTDASSLLPNLPGVFTGAVTWFDYDGDGLLDLSIIGDSQDGPVSLLYHNQGQQSTFEDQSVLIPGLPQVANGGAKFGDYDRDGRPDLYITGLNSFLEAVSGLYHNMPSGFEKSSAMLGEAAVVNSSAAWVDYDNDGWNDLMITGTAGSSDVTSLLHNINANSDSIFAGLANMEGNAAWGDYDNDGKMDVMITGHVGTSESYSYLYHNTGNGFEDKTSLLPQLPVFANSSLAWADYDNDGKLDLFISGQVGLLGGDPESRLYHNTGNGFSDVTTLLPNLQGFTFPSIKWSDYDNDGKKDLFITGASSSSNLAYQLFHNTGSGFEEKTSLLPVNDAAQGAAAWGDYNGDGYTDLILTGGAVTKLFYNNKGLGFSDTTSLLPDIPNKEVQLAAWADYDIDGKLDLFANGALYHNTGSGFSPTTGLMPGLQNLEIRSVQWGDYDNDGWPDLLLSASSGALLYHNTGAGFELIPFIAGNMVSGAAFGDYDNDGRLDILQLNVNGNTLFHNLTGQVNTVPTAPAGLEIIPSPDGVSVTLTWKAATDAQTLSTGLNYNLYVGTTPGGQDIVSPMSDLNNGYRRVVQQGNSQYNSYALNGLALNHTYYWSVQAIDGAYMASPFAPEQQFTTTQTIDQSMLLPGLPDLASGSAVWGDYDNDKKLDLFISGDGIGHLWSKLYHNNGSGFEDSSILMPGLPGLMNGQSAWADYDNDGKLDLLVTGEDSLGAGTTILYHNTGSGFENKTSVIPGVPSLYYSSVAFGDYNNDGHPDLILSGGQTGGYPGIVTRLYYNTGKGAFLDSSILIPGQPSLENGSVNWVDFNKDGKLDLFITGYFFDGMHNYLYQNTGNGFTDVSTLIPNLPGIQSGSSVWADYDMDGYPDLFVTGVSVYDDPSSAISRLYHNNNGAGFTDASTLLPDLPGFSNSAAAWGDYDNDGRPDLIISGFAGAAGTPTTLVYLNTKSGFAAAQFAKGFPQAGNSAIALGDYDNDGRIDLFISGLSGRSETSKLFHNPSLKANTAPQAPVSLQEKLSPDGKSVTLHWQGAFDQDTPGDGLHYNVYVSDAPGKQNVVGAASDIGTGTRLLAATGNSQGNSFIVTELIPGKKYYWSVQAIDPSFAGSVFAAEQTFTVSPLQVPGTITTNTYPNPAKDRVTININGGEDGKVIFRLYNANGQLLQLRNAVISGGISTESFDIGYLASGIYFMQINIGTGTTRTLKVIKQ